MSTPIVPPNGLNGLLSGNGNLLPLGQRINPFAYMLGNNGGGGDLNSAIAGMPGGGGLMGVYQGPPPPSNPGFSGNALNAFVSGGAPQAPMAPDVNYPSELNQTAGQMSPLDQLLAQEQQQLSGIGNIGSYEMPYSQIQSMAQNMTNAQYDPQINNLLGQMAQQKQLTAQNQGKASDMYNALGQSFVDDIPQVQAQTKAEADATKAQYDSSQQQLQQQYQSQSAGQQDALSKLGIQAALGNGSAGNANVVSQNAPGVQGVGEQQKTDQNYLQGQMVLQNQQAQNTLASQGDSATHYQQQMADSSRLQGQNDVTNLQNALQNYLTGAQTQQQSLVGAKASALAGMEGQLQWQNIQNAQTQYQNAFNRVLAENNFGLDVQKEGDANTQAMNSLLAALQENQNQYGAGTVNRPGTTGNSGGMTGAAAELSNLYSQGNSGMGAQDMSGILQAVQNAMNDSAQANLNAQQHGMRPILNDMNYDNTFLKQELAKSGITNPQDLAAAYQALLAYNQKLQ